MQLTGPAINNFPLSLRLTASPTHPKTTNTQTERTLQEIRARTRMSTARDIQLIEAVENGQAQRVRQLLADGANPNTRKRVTLTCSIEGETKTDTVECESALTLAIIHANEDIVKALLEGGADANLACEWKVADWGSSWNADRWNRTRWYWTFSFPSALTLAMARGGKWTWWDGRTEDSPYPNNKLSINHKGGHIQLKDPAVLQDARIRFFTVRPSLPIVKLLLSHGAAVAQREFDAARKQPDGRFLQ
ncbi:hypothetical protein HDU93_005786, partial [Gonapodya sp. JEL0774]